MGRIGRTYPRAPELRQAPISKGRVLFLSPTHALRYRLHRTQTLVWLCLIIGIIGASVTASF